MGKTKDVYVVDRDNMGHFNPSNNSQIVQNYQGTPIDYFSTPAYFQGNVYISGESAPLEMHNLNNGLIVNPPAATASTSFGYPGSNPSISANGSTNGIVWVVQPTGKVTGGNPAILRAYNASNLTELYNSTQAGTRDTMGLAVKFCVPTVANGKVYVGTQSGFDAFGLLP